MKTMKKWMDRAGAAIGRPTLYWAGAGGESSQQAYPGSDFLLVSVRDYGRKGPISAIAAGAPRYRGANLRYDSGAAVLEACDCSGFVCWALELKVRMNTSAIHADAIGPRATFRRIEAPRIGCLAVYPKPPDGSERFGHVGFVSGLDHEGKPSRFVHCSGSNFAQHQDAIQENATDAFRRQAATLFVWPVDADG